MQRICVFCGSKAGERPAYRALAERTGAMLAEAGVGIVFGGGAIGIMGAVADAALAAGGEVIGVIPRALAVKEVAHDGVSRLEIVETMHERKARMAELSDAFLALPGGLGTFEELFEVLTWGQLGIHRKPCGVLDVEGFFRPLGQLLDRAVADGFVDPVNRAMVLEGTDPADLLARFRSYEPPPVPAWLDWSST